MSDAAMPPETLPKAPPNVDRFGLFPTPVFVYDLADVEELNAELRAQLVAESKSSPGIEQSNVGAWHSPADLGHRIDGSFREILGKVVTAIGDTITTLAAGSGVSIENQYSYGVQSWAVVTPTGGYAVAHDHVSAHFSTAYYVDAGDADDAKYPSSGLLAFIKPGRAETAIPGLDVFPSTFTVKPRSGRLVVFPGSLQHYVHPYRGTRERVCISSNLLVEIAPRG